MRIFRSKKRNKKKKKKSLQTQKGQAMLTVVGLLGVGLMVMSTNILLGIIGHDQTLMFQQSNQGRALAEAGLEEACIRMLRDPSYSGGTLEIDGKDVIITVSGNNPKTITSQVDYFGKEKGVELKTTLGSGEMDINSWKEY